MTSKDNKHKQPAGTPAKPPKITDWQKKAEDCLAGWQRTQADFDNYRKRMEQVQMSLSQLATAELGLKIVPILDDFRRALAGLPPSEAQSAWATGVRHIEKRLRQILADDGWQPIENAGAFNPYQHEAIAADYHPLIPEGDIIDLVELGWQLGDKVMKPARVRVSKGPKLATNS